jgi:putative SOS response-associated peptidase YedK
MCGRLTIHSSPDLVAQRFGVAEPLPDLGPCYNAAPLQQLPVVRLNPETRRRTLSLLRWGLVPVWARDPATGSRMLNARCETVAEKPAFKAAFRKRRCLLAADAFYEWKKVGGGKQPYAATTTDTGRFGMAGLWEGSKNPDGGWEHTFHHHDERQRRRRRAARPHAGDPATGRLAGLAR